MIDLTQIYKDIRNHLQPKVSTGVLIVRAEQNAPRPNESGSPIYITMKTMMPNVQVGLESIVLSEIADEAETSAAFLLPIIINAYGEGSHSELHNLRMRILSRDTKDFLISSGYPLADISEITDTTTLLDSSFEERGSMILTLSYVDTYTESAEHVEIVDIDDAELACEDGTVVETIDVYVDKNNP